MLGSVAADSTLAQDADTVYGYDVDSTPPGSSQRYKILAWPKAGGTRVLVAGQVPSEPKRMILDQGALYWVSGWIWKAPLSGSGAVSVSSGTSFEGLALDATRFYTSFSDGSKWTIIGVDRSTGATSTLGDSPGAARAIDIDTDTVYWSYAGGISSVPKIGGTVSPRASSPTPFALIVRNGDLYWAEYLSDGAIMKLAQGASSPIELSNGHGNPTALVLSGGHLYWSGYAAGIWRVPSAGSGTEQLLGTGYASDLQVDGSTVYWVTSTFASTPFAGQLNSTAF
jgi:hypothetical protein